MTLTSAIGAKPGRRRGGFTLVELLLVLTIISLSATAVVLSLPEQRPSLTREAERFAARLSRAQDAAIIENRPIAVTVDRSGYEFQRRIAGNWSPLAIEPFRRTAWDEDTRIQLPSDDGVRLVFEPTGYADPMQVALRRAGESRIVRIGETGSVEVRADAADR